MHNIVVYVHPENGILKIVWFLRVGMWITQWFISFLYWNYPHKSPINAYLQIYKARRLTNEYLETIFDISNTKY